MPDFGQTSSSGATGSGQSAGNLFLSGGPTSEDGTLESVTIYVSSGGSANAYVGIYKSSTDDPTGATLIGSTGNLTGNYGTAGFETFALTGSLSFSSGDWLWLVPFTVEGSDSGNFATYITTDSGDWADSTTSGVGMTNYIIGDYTSPPATLPSGTTDYSSSVLVGYVTYSPGGSSIAPVASRYFSMMRTA